VAELGCPAPHHYSPRTGEKAVRRPLGALQDSISAARQQLSALIGQSERTILLGTVLLS
jgi:hypothetical protein